MIYTTRKIKFRAAALLTVLMLIFGVTAPFCGSCSDEQVIRIPCGLNDLLQLDPDGEPFGYFRDYLDKLAAINNWRYEYIETNWNDAVEMLDNGELDLLFPTNLTADRMKTMDFSSLACGYTAAGLFTLSGSQYNYEDFGSWKNVRIAVTKNSSNERDLQNFAAEKGFTYTPVYIDSMEDKITALNEGKTDMIIFAASNAVPDGELLAVLDATPFFLTVKKGNEDLMNQINSAMQQMMTDSPDLISQTAHDCLVGSNIRIQALTSDEREFLKSGQEITVGFYVDTEPLAYVRSDGEYCGVYPDLMRYVQEQSGLNIRLVPLTRDKNWRDYLSDGTIDF